MTRLSSIISFCAFLFLCSPVCTVHAQFASEVTRAQIVTAPAYPEPGETLTASLNAYAFNLNGASISWYLNGEEQTSQKNRREITLRAGARGDSAVLTALMTLADGRVVRAERTITPARVDIVVEANTQVPLFYKGRALPSSDSTVRVVALPFTDTPVSNLSFTWQVDEKVLYGGPLLGQDVAEFTIPFGGSAVVTVSVADQAGNVFTTKAVEVVTVEPMALFYEDNPLRGLSRVTLSTPKQMTGEEITVRAEPYYMGNNIQANDQMIEWKINGTTIQNPSADPYNISLRRTGTTGRFNVSFHIRNLADLLQGVEDTFVVQF